MKNEAMKKDDPYGDGGAARVREPETPQRNNKGQGSLGASKEASGGVARSGEGKVDKSRSSSTGHPPRGSDRS